MPTPSPDVLRQVCEPLCAAAGLDLESLDVATAGRRRRVLVVVDKDGGVDMDECAELSRAVSEAMDAQDVMGEGAYTLEVSSPGVSRPLTAPRHWRRATGRLVRAVLATGGELTGRVTAADDAGADLDVEGTSRRVAYDQVAKARVQVEFSRPGEPADADGADDRER